MGEILGLTPLKSNIDTKNDGLLNVSPASNTVQIRRHFGALHVSFRGCTRFREV